MRETNHRAQTGASASLYSPSSSPSGPCDRRDGIKPPPYFPTTERYFKNRYYEIDPVRFSVAGWFAANQ
jgi:hypothetical protein